MGLINNILDKFNKAEFTVAPQKKLKTISADFKKAFNLTLVFYYCCPIKLISFYRHMLGYRSGGSRVTFFICKPPLFKQ